MGQDRELLTRYIRGRGCWCCGRGARERMFLRQLGDLIYKRFAILPNVEDQKYTIGDTFTSREEQGEFIFWTRPGYDDEQMTSSSSRKSKKENNNMCEIYCVKNQYWVNPLNGEIFINDVKINKKTILKLGDSLAFGKRVEKHTVNTRGSKSKRDKDAEKKKQDTKDEDKDNRYDEVFLVKERELDPSAFLESEIRRNRIMMERLEEDKKRLAVVNKRKNSKALYNGNSVPLQNDLVLSHILSYLPFSDLKTVRFVSKLWNDESLKIIKKKAVVKFGFGSGYSATNESMKFFRYANEMKKNPLPNWEINLPSLGATRGDHYKLDTAPGRPGSKLLADLDWFLVTQDVVKQLTLRGELESRLDYDILIKTLNNLPLGTIQNFELAGEWALKALSGTAGLEFPTTISFKILQEFTLSMGAFNDEGYHVKDCSTMTWLTPLAMAVKRVRALHLRCKAPLSLSFIQQSESFPNLEQISFHYVNPEGLKFLQKLNKPLSKLELNRLIRWKSADVLAFQKFLQKHSNSLKSLQFILPNCSQGSMALELPIFPQLKALNIGYGSSGDDDDDDNGIPAGTNENVPVTVAFHGEYGPETISYGKHFPSLQSLTLWPSGYGKYRATENYRTYLSDITEFWKKHTKFYEIFFPPHQDEHEPPLICKTVYHLDVPHQSWDYPDRQLHFFPRAAEIAAMFPNVVNAWTTEIRKPVTVPPPRPEKKVLRSTSKKVKVDFTRVLRPRRTTRASKATSAAAASTTRRAPKRKR